MWQKKNTRIGYAGQGVIGKVNEGASTSGLQSRNVPTTTGSVPSETIGYDETATSVTWTRQQTMLLLELCAAHTEDIRDSSRKRKTVWQEIVVCIINDFVMTSQK